MQSTHDLFNSIDLRGVKVWLSGAVPEPKGKPNQEDTLEVWKGSEAETGILAFVQIFSALVFKYGGEVIHGCHPSFTPILLEQSRRFADAVSKVESPLHLFVSDYFSNDQSRKDWERWRRLASVEITEKTGLGDEHLKKSLGILRATMATKCSAFVAIGGKWWDDVPGRAGVPIELEMAKKKTVPCFVLGGFGGISSMYAKENPTWFAELHNKLSNEDNQFLASNTNFNLVAGIIVSQLNKAEAR